MAMKGEPDRGITQSDTVLGLHKGTTLERGNEKNSPEDICKSENFPILRSEGQSCSPDGIRRLSDSNQKHGPRPNPASDFWAQGLAKVKVLDVRSNGNQKIGDSTAVIKEPGNPHAERDTAESALIQSGDQLHRSRVLSFLRPGSTSAPSSRVDHQAPSVPKYSVSVSKDVPNSRNKASGQPLGDPLRKMARDVAEPDQLLELEAEKGCSTTPASVSKSPTSLSRDGNEDNLVNVAGTVPLHTEHVRSTVTTRLKIEDNLDVRLDTEKIKPTIPMIPSLDEKASSHLSPPKRQQITETPSKPSHAPEYNESSSAKATSHLSLSKPCPVIPITPTSNNKVRHLKSFSVDAPTFHPSPPSSSPTTPISPYRKDHEKSVSIGSGHSNPSYVSAMPKTPYWQPSARHSRQTSMGTPSTPIDSGILRNPGAPSQPSLGLHYPGPHQHTPEGQGQYFDIQALPVLMPAHFSGSLSPNVLPFPFSVDSFNNSAFDQNAQMYKQGEQDAEYSQSNHFDFHASSQAANAAPNAADLHQNGDMYTQDTNGFGPRYYSNHTDPAHQVRICPLRLDHSRLMNT